MPAIRDRIDDQLAPWHDVPDVRPGGGWVRAIRSGLGMSVTELARRLGISQPSASQLEQAEQDGSITLARLERAARALDCTLVYALVPNAGSTAEAVRRRATERAQADVDETLHSMSLEAQPVSDRAARRMLDDAIAEWMASRRLWSP